MSTTATQVVSVSLAELAAEADFLYRLRDDAMDRSEFHAYGIAVSVLHRLSNGAVGQPLRDQPGWNDDRDGDGVACDK